MFVKDPDLPYPYQFPEPAGLTPKRGGIMRIAATWNVATMDPTASAAGGTITAPNMVYNRLLGMVGGPRKNPFTIELEPELASSWERTPDGATFSFGIREDIKWQNVAPLNGRPFTAQDAKYAFDRYATEGVHQSYWANVSEISTPDDYSMVLQMSKVTADFILPLASRYQTIFPRELVENGTISEQIVGTGPMILEEAEAGSHATFKRNPDYFEREVLLDGVEFRLRQDYTARLAGFRVGQFDYVYGLAPNIVQLGKILETNPDVQINFTPVVNGTSPFGMNLSNPKFADERVRQALTLGIDTALIAELLYDNISKTLPLQPWPYVFDEEPTVESGNLGRFAGRYDPRRGAEAAQGRGRRGVGVRELLPQLLEPRFGPARRDHRREPGEDRRQDGPAPRRLHRVQLDLGARQAGGGLHELLAHRRLRPGQLLLQLGALGVARQPLAAQRPAGRRLGGPAAGRARPGRPEGDPQDDVGLLPGEDVLAAAARGDFARGLPAVGAGHPLRRGVS